MKSKLIAQFRSKFRKNGIGGIYGVSLASFAFAQSPAGSPAQAPSSLPSLLPLVLILAVFYFILIRPQKKQMKQQQAMINSLKKGDDIVTSGGVHGKVSALKGKEIELEIAPNTRILLSKQAVARMLTDTGSESVPDQETQK